MTLPSSKTQPSIRAAWIGRHFASVGASVGVSSAILATLIASLRVDIDPLKASVQYGLPTALCVALAMALVWTFAIHLPRRDQAEEERLRRIHEVHLAEVAHLREVMDAAMANAEERDGRRDRLFEETIAKLLSAHTTATQATREDIRDVRGQVERIHDRLDGLTTGPRAKIGRPIMPPPPTPEDG